MTVADYTAPSLMVQQLKSETGQSIVAELCAVLERDGRLPDARLFFEAVFSRERIGSTVFSAGWALPHARLSGVPELCFTVGISARPVLWHAEPRCLVHTVFLLAVPESQTKTYLNLISALARLSQNAALVAEL
jgi:mannitol/fructose-specific phosphotransferase system IIA component (Ntr-type)